MTRKTSYGRSFHQMRGGGGMRGVEVFDGMEKGLNRRRKTVSFHERLWFVYFDALS